MHRLTSAAWRAGTVVVVATALLVGVGPAPAQDQMPDTFPELGYAFDHTFQQILTAKELELLRTLSPEELKETDRETYEKVSQNVERWTDDWLAHISDELESIPPERLAAAVASATHVDGLLRSYFESKGWPYRTMRVVFLPQRVFHDSRARYWRLQGAVMRYYPDAMFASVDPSAPTSHILVHETIHFNKQGPSYPWRLTEGITETATRRFVEQQGLMTSKQLRRDQYYEDERKRVDAILDAMIERAGGTRDEALDVLLGAYLTGDQSGMEEIFGADAWERVLALPSQGAWYPKDIRRVLEKGQT